MDLNVTSCQHLIAPEEYCSGIEICDKGIKMEVIWKFSRGIFQKGGAI
jgi:hypothetical protein